MRDFVYPGDFAIQQIETNGAALDVRTAGRGGPVALIHGYAETGEMWVPLAVDLPAPTFELVLTCSHLDRRGFMVETEASGEIN